MVTEYQYFGRVQNHRFNSFLINVFSADPSFDQIFIRTESEREKTFNKMKATKRIDISSAYLISIAFPLALFGPHHTKKQHKTCSE